MKQVIQNQTMDAERALYHLQDALVENCTFAGEADGESALKESRRVEVRGCHFHLRYPLWHAETFSLADCTMAETARAALWYAKDGSLENCDLRGVKLLRECEGIRMHGCTVDSTEFGWRCRDLQIGDCTMSSEYFLFESRNIAIRNLQMRGKYSFQYVDHMTVENSVLDTKDAFWHAHDVTVRDTVIRGEYLGWYSDGLTLIRCRIIGTQPLCYCKNLTLIDCTMEDADLAFEYSDVRAEILSPVVSIKNPLSGRIHVKSVGEIITDDAVYPCNCEIRVDEEQTR